MNRLFVTSLKSIGLVSEGDNPEADVVIWKSHTEREVSDLLSGPILGEPGSSHTSTATSTTATVDQRIASMDQRLARMNRSLADLNRRIARLKEKRKERLARLATIPPKERNPRTMTDKEPQDLNELVIDKLDAYARKQQFEGEIAGRYGYLSTPREEMVVKIRVAWHATPGGKAVTELLRERGGDPADLTTIQKSHSEAYAAIAQLDG